MQRRLNTLRKRLTQTLQQAKLIEKPAAASKTWVPPGHHYSPIPAPEQMREKSQRIWGPSPETLPGLSLQPERQLELLEKMKPMRTDLAYTSGVARSWRYAPDNSMFGIQSARALHLMMRALQPKLIVEAGSGYSSAVMLDTSEHFMGWHTKCVFIEPYTDRLRGLLKPGDERYSEVMEQGLETVDPSVYARLSAGDVLFVDSTHISKTGSDVNHLLFEVLPALKPGVYVHFHDILYPFEYPERWVMEGRAWNEAYILRAFLSYNTDFEVQFWASYLFQHHREALETLPEICGDGSSLWIKKVR